MLCAERLHRQDRRSKRVGIVIGSRIARVMRPACAMVWSLSLSVALLAGSIAQAGPARSAPPDEEQRGIVLLTGNVWAKGARRSIEGRAMVCNLRDARDYLSLRTQPTSSATEIVKLNPLTILTLTGATRGKWAEVGNIVFEVGPNGQLLPESSQGTAPIRGWVHSDYLCNYLY